MDEIIMLRNIPGRFDDRPCRFAGRRFRAHTGCGLEQVVANRPGAEVSPLLRRRGTVEVVR